MARKLVSIAGTAKILASEAFWLRFATFDSTLPKAREQRLAIWVLFMVSE
jgi:hypothetical protein